MGSGRWRRTGRLGGRSWRGALAVAGLPGPVAAGLRLADGSFLPDQGAAGRMVEVARAVRAEILGFRPEVVLTHPYEGGHPDHDAVAFAVWAALRGMREEDRPEIVEAAGYHAGTGGEDSLDEDGRVFAREVRGGAVCVL